MSWNTDLFLLLNAPVRPSDAGLFFVEFLATSPVMLAPVLLACLWVWGHPDRRSALIAVGTGLFIGQGLNLLLGIAWYEPRPFMIGVGHVWLAHAPDNGFPSDHATLAWSLGLGLMLTRAAPRWGAAACLLGLGAGWARVYLGIHFPVDVLSSAPVGLVAGITARLIVPAAQTWVSPPAERLYEAILRRLPDQFPLPRRFHP